MWLKKQNWILLLLSLPLLSCTTEDLSGLPEDPVVSRQGRMLGIDLLNMSQSGTFSENLLYAEQASFNFIGVHLLWTAFEDNTGSGSTSGNFTDPGHSIRSFIDVLQGSSFQFSLTIRPIDLTGKTVPSDLADYRFDDEDFQSRFRSLISFVLNITGSDNVTTIQDYLTSIQIGNEIDGYDTSGEHPDFWSHYGSFLADARAHIQSINPEIKVGFTATFHGATLNDTNKAIFNALAGAVDVIGITYYPIDSNFDVYPPGQVKTDIPYLVSSFSASGKPIYLQEVGYQTSSVNNSSEEKQAQFFAEFFQVWDEYYEEIPLVNIVRLNDISDQAAEDMAIPYGLGSNAFKEYLRTLGLRTYPGTGSHKDAFTLIQEETAKRNW